MSDSYFTSPPVVSREQRETETLAKLYELRLQLATAADAASKLGWLLPAVMIKRAGDDVDGAICLIETKNPHLT